MGDGSRRTGTAATRPGTLPAGVLPAEQFARWSGDPSFMLSLARGMLVLTEVAAAAGRPISARQVSHRTGLPVAAAQRCLYTLQALGYVRANRNGAVPGAALAELAGTYAASSPLVWNCGAVLDALHEALDVTTSLAVFEGEMPMIVASRASDAIMRLQLPIGAMLPLHCTSAGKIFLAGLTDAELACRLATLELPACTPHTITDAARLAQEIERVRGVGHAVSDQEHVMGVRTVAVAVRNPRGEAVASLNASTLRAAVPLRRLRQQVVPALLRAASHLSGLLA